MRKILSKIVIEIIILSIEVESHSYLERIIDSKSRCSNRTISSSHIKPRSKHRTRITKVEHNDKLTDLWQKYQIIQIILKIAKISSNLSQHRSVHIAYMIDEISQR
jgi:hypothetical protein